MDPLGVLFFSYCSRTLCFYSIFFFGGGGGTAAGPLGFLVFGFLLRHVATCRETLTFNLEGRAKSVARDAQLVAKYFIDPRGNCDWFASTLPPPKQISKT